MQLPKMGPRHKMRKHMKHIFARKVELAYTGTLGTKILSIIDSFHSIMPL
jgi:hypothetical protein